MRVGEEGHGGGGGGGGGGVLVGWLGVVFVGKVVGHDQKRKGGEGHAGRKIGSDS